VLWILANRTYRHLLAAQVIALIGTGLATVALSLLAYDLAGADAGAVLGIALAIKMVAYIGVAPVVGAFADRLPRRAFLVSMDLVRCASALVLPFVTQVWQVYVLIFVLQSASAAFTPTFQATIPDVLPEERDYTRALSLSRLAYDLESLASPALAAALLNIVSFHWLFAGTAIGFIASALLVVSVVLPRTPAKARSGGILDKTTRGARIYLKTPRLRGLLAVTLAAAAASAMVIVNTVVIVRHVLHLPQAELGVALAVYGGGSMLTALLLPRALERLSDRSVMISGAALLTVGLVALGAWFEAGQGWTILLAIWFVLGIGYSLSVTPSGRLLRRSANPEDRPAVFAAQFALSHACWLIAYPLAGVVGDRLGLKNVALLLATLAASGTMLAILAWPTADPEVVPHDHPELPKGHPHLREGHSADGEHVFVIDDLHPAWPGNG
jgi:H+ antiporter protein